MASTFETVAEIIANTSDVPVENVRPDSHIMKDLGIDSLAFLDIAFEIDQRFNIQMPIENWMQNVNEAKESSDQYFVVKDLCRHIDELVSATAVA